MSGTQRWADLRDARLDTPERRASYEAARVELDAVLAAHRETLTELRRARSLTQAQLARSLGVSQAQVSRIEHQADLYLSTLRSYLQAMDGELELIATFPDGTTVPLQLADLLTEHDDGDTAQRATA